MPIPIPSCAYETKPYDLHGLHGISDQTVAMHLALYAGYVAETNHLTNRIREMSGKGKMNQEEQLIYSELKRRLGFEYNGMLLHEYYFDNLSVERANDPGHDSTFRRVAEESFGTYEAWKVDFMSVGKMRGVGWGICYLNPYNGALSNHWITLHETGNIVGFVPVLVMDVWEHAFLLDYKPSERGAYIDSFFANIDWKSVESRLRQTGPASFVSA